MKTDPAQAIYGCDTIMKRDLLRVLVFVIRIRTTAEGVHTNIFRLYGAV